jgi:hypothetical protein
VRRFVLVVLSSAILLSACSSSGFPQPNKGASEAPTMAASEAASVAATIAATPTDAPTDAPTATLKATVAPTAAPTQAAGADWTAISPAGAGFTAKFPGTPTQSSQSFSTAAGDAPASLWILEESSDLAFFAVEARYPAGSMSGLSTSAVYDGAITGMTGSTAGLTVDSQSNVTLGGHAGRAFTLTSTAASIKGEMFLVGDNLYMVYAAYDSLADPTEIDTFIGDFSLTV